MSDEIHPYIQLQQQIHHALRVQHPDWVEPNGNCPTCDSYESRLADLLGLSPQTNSAQLRKGFAKLRGRATDDSLKRAIEVRHGLKSACESSFANSRVGIEQKRLRLLHSNSREVVDEIYPGRFLEHLAKVMPADVSRVGYAPEG